MEFSFRFIKLGIFGNLTCPTFSFILICPLISPPLLNFLMLKLKICQKLEKFTLNSTSGDFPQTPTMSFWWPSFLKYWCFSLVQGFQFTNQPLNSPPLQLLSWILSIQGMQRKKFNLKKLKFRPFFSNISKFWALSDKNNPGKVWIF